MSTYYATLPTWEEAKLTTEELVDGGVRPDDLSLLIRTGKLGKKGEIREFSGSVGDASYLVGREDDPSRDRLAPPHEDIGNYTSTDMSRLNPIDTSNKATDVDSVDQMDDSQNEVEFMISPHDGISHSAHEKDDLALAVLTGFPTASSNFAEEPSDPFTLQEESEEGLEVIEISGVGLVIGGGALATAALDLGVQGNACLVKFLVEEGVPEEIAETLQKDFEAGQAIIAIEITPGKLDEAAVEEIVERHGATNGELYDAPRY